MFSTGEAADSKPQEEQPPVRLLHIGNSFSYNATAYLPQLAKAGGKKLEVFGAALGGASLERHATLLRDWKGEKPESGRAYKVTPVLGEKFAGQKKISLEEALQAQPWDIVTIQQVSGNSFRPETFEPFASELIAEIRSASPTAEIRIHQTWAYRSDHPLFKKEPTMNPEKMHLGLTATYGQFAQRYQIKNFFPSGLAIEMANRTGEWGYRLDPDFDYNNPPAEALPNEKGLYAGARLAAKNKEGKRPLIVDAFHLNTAGKYLLGCVWYELIFDDSVVNVDFSPKDLSAEQAKSLRQLAHEAVAAYRQHGLSGGLPARGAAAQP